MKAVIMGLVSLLLHDPVLFCLLVPILLYSVIFHEVAHGAMALLFGDDTARRYGRLTLNPLPHIDILGAFNLIPIPPLDGSKILIAFLPPSAQERLAAIEPYGFFILIILLFSGLLNHAIALIENGIYGVIGLLLGRFP